VHRVDELAPRRVELLDALDLEQVDDLVVADAERVESAEDLARRPYDDRTESPAMTPWSATASIVACGIVLTVPGAMSCTTYCVSS
jgi:hypothetical protein